MFRPAFGVGVAAALVAYLCLYPFNFALPLSAIALDGLATDRPSLADAVANLVLYLPFGAMIGLALRERLRLPAILAVAGIASFALSLSIELLQQTVPGRFSSAGDLACNTLSGLFGVPLARFATWRGWPDHPRFHYAAAVVACWVSSRLIPFKPSVHWRVWRDALLGLAASPSAPVTSVLVHAGAALGAFHALRITGAVPRFQWLACAALACGVLGGRVLTASLGADPAEWWGLALALLAWGVLLRAPEEKRSRWVVRLAVTAGFLLDGLRPFALADEATAFDWVPLGSLIHDQDRISALRSLASHLFWAMALVLAWGRRASTGWALGGALAALALGVELVQTWLPGRYADTGPPLMMLAAAAWLAKTMRATSR